MGETVTILKSDFDSMVRDLNDLRDLVSVYRCPVCNRYCKHGWQHTHVETNNNEE